MLYEMEKKVYLEKERIIQQNAVGEKIFLIFSGVVKLDKLLRKQDYKEVLYKANFKKKYNVINVCEMRKNEIFGEEILYNSSGKYDYQVTVQSKNAVIYCFKKTFYEVCPPGTKTGIRKIYKRRR